MERIPAVHAILDPLLRDPEVSQYHPEFVKGFVREAIARIRNQGASLTLERTPPVDHKSPEGVSNLIVEIKRQIGDFIAKSGYTPVINATGVVIHTNLGRSCIPPLFLQKMADQLKGYGALELELDSGKRGGRGERLNDLIRRTLGCDGAMVVNNNASAVLLILNTLAKGRKAIISRGELVEIGGSFRIPEIMALAGTQLVEVGTTNRTTIADYEQAIRENPDTALLLKVHTSNFSIIGYHASATTAELVELSRKFKIPFYEDPGSGLIFPFMGEATLGDKLKAGCRILSFSGDKLLGGTQAGVILADGDTLLRLRGNPLYRCLRVGKETLFLLEELFKAYLCYSRPEEMIPTLAMLQTPVATIASRVDCFRAQLSPPSNLEVTALPLSSQAGGGALPDRSIPSHGLALVIPGVSPTDLLEKLRRHSPPVIGYIREERVILDFRTIGLEEEPAVARMLETL